MSAQPEVLRLADALQQQAVWEGHYGPSYLRDLLPEAAAELRRLHAENKVLHERHHDGNVILTQMLAQRDALLEACKVALSIIGFGAEHDQISDAIKAAEGEKK